jgi:hypothetical protein
MTLNVRVGLGGVEEKVVGDGSGEGGVDGSEDGGVLEHISDTWTKKTVGRTGCECQLMRSEELAEMRTGKVDSGDEAGEAAVGSGLHDVLAGGSKDGVQDVDHTDGGTGILRRRKKNVRSRPVPDITRVRSGRWLST